MNYQLIPLLDEVCTGVEVYYGGRTGGQSLNAAFILCDDYTELVSKVFLLDRNGAWSDRREKGNFKSYPEIIDEVVAACRADDILPAETIGALGEVQDRLRQRHRRRNDFSHSPNLLDLTVNARNCVEAYCDLLDYGTILFGEDWRVATSSARNLDTFELLLRVERLAFTDPAVGRELSELVKEWPRNAMNQRGRGVHQVAYPEDLHLRVSAVSGGSDLREALRRLIES